MSPYIKLNNKYIVCFLMGKNNICLRPHVLKGVSSHGDTGNCLTKFRTDVSRCIDTLEISSDAEPLKTKGAHTQHI